MDSIVQFASVGQQSSRRAGGMKPPDLRHPQERFSQQRSLYRSAGDGPVIGGLLSTFRPAFLDSVLLLGFEDVTH